VAGLTEWKNRRGSGIMDDLALSLAETTIQHFTSQLELVDQAIAETIDNDVELSAKRDLLVSINGVGEALAGIVLAELPGPDILGSSAAVAAYAGLNPQQRQSGISVNRPVRISKIGNAVLRAALYMPALSAMRYNPAVIALVDRLKAQGRLKGKQKADCDRCHAQASGALLRRAEDRQGIRPGDGNGQMTRRATPQPGVDRMVSTSWSRRRRSSPAARQGRALARGLEGRLPLQHHQASDQNRSSSRCWASFSLAFKHGIYRDLSLPPINH
jgi:hypothetical protein